MKYWFWQISAFLMFLAIPVHAQDSQYRSDVPAVLSAPQQPETDINGIIKRFRKSYAAVGKPRIVVFWNRTFSAQLATNYDHYTTSSAQTTTSGSHVEGSYNDQHVRISRHSADAYGHTATAGSHYNTSKTENETHSGVRAVDNNDASTPDTNNSEDWTLQGTFLDTLSEVPVNLIDRATIMRTSARGKAATETSNLQSIEASAIAAKADYILEIQGLPDSSSQSGYKFKIEIHTVKSGKIIVGFTTKGIPVEASQIHYVAGSHGFERAEMSLSDEDVGRELALETLERLTRYWK